MQTFKSMVLLPGSRFGYRAAVTKIALLFLLIFLSMHAFPQAIATKPTPAQKPTDTLKHADVTKAALLPKDSIISIKNMRNQQDSSRINEVIAIRVFTQKDMSAYDSLYVNGICMVGLKPWKISCTEKTVYFKLDKKVQDVLTSFLESTPFETTVVPVYFSVGNNAISLIKAKDPIYIEVKQKINEWWVYAAALLVAITAGYALYHNVLKDNANLYYSLASVQLFYWTILFVIAYLEICLKTDTLPDIPLSVLAILGISLSTTAVAKVIDNNAKGAAVIDEKAESQGWFVDILSDGSSINIQRFQNVAFNAFFGVLFLQKAFSTHLLPDFDSNVLLLLGISAGAYAGLKNIEPAKEQTKNAPTTVGDLADITKESDTKNAATAKTVDAKPAATDTNSATNETTEPPAGEDAS